MHANNFGTVSQSGWTISVSSIHVSNVGSVSQSSPTLAVSNIWVSRHWICQSEQSNISCQQYTDKETLDLSEQSIVVC